MRDAAIRDAEVVALDGGREGVELPPQLEAERERDAEQLGGAERDADRGERGEASVPELLQVRGVRMYHDQALIPLKLVDFREAVNVSMGLPFLRTSPDHGTALSRAGTGTADPGSMIAAWAAGANLKPEYASML